MEQVHKRILVIGPRLHTYPRHHVMLGALSSVASVEEAELRSERGSIFTALSILRKRGSGCDAVLFIQPAQRLAPLIFLYRVLSGKKIVGDAFTSLYDTFVFDRKLIGRMSPKALYYFFLDWLFVHACDVLLFDTEEHRDYFVKTFHIGRKTELLIAPVSVDMDVMNAVEPQSFRDEPQAFNVLFWGLYIPLQGVEYIIGAAAILKDHPHIRFTLIGSGQTKDAAVKLASELRLTNVSFLLRMPYPELLAATKVADLMLGIFGESEKAGRVIPNKVIDGMALGVPVVTGKNSPMSRCFTDSENIFFCRMADADDLAKTILRAYNAENLREVGKRGQEVVLERFSKVPLTQIFSSII
jgi:glycosyltransferase involved in cell wall biosynthesis